MVSQRDLYRYLLGCVETELQQALKVFGVTAEPKVVLIGVFGCHGLSRFASYRKVDRRGVTLMGRVAVITRASRELGGPSD